SGAGPARRSAPIRSFPFASWYSYRRAFFFGSSAHPLTETSPAKRNGASRLRTALSRDIARAVPPRGGPTVAQRQGRACCVPGLGDLHEFEPICACSCPGVEGGVGNPETG